MSFGLCLDVTHTTTQIPQHGGRGFRGCCGVPTPYRIGHPSLDCDTAFGVAFLERHCLPSVIPNSRARCVGFLGAWFLLVSSTSAMAGRVLASCPRRYVAARCIKGSRLSREVTELTYTVWTGHDHVAAWSRGDDCIAGSQWQWYLTS